MLEAFEISGRAVDLVGEAASASQGRVGAAELAGRPFLRRGELLEVIPGVVITQHSGGGKANQYFLRGFNLDHGTDFSISADGMPVNQRTHAHGQGYADLNFLIPELVREVDFNKGPFYAEVGDFSAAGAAAYRFFDELPRDFVSLEAGEHGYGRAVAGRTLNRGGDATTIGLEAEHYDGPWARKDDFRRLNFFGRQLWRRGGGTLALTALGYVAEWNASDQIPERAVAAGLLGRFGNLDASGGGDTQRFSLSADWRRGDQASGAQANVYLIRSELDLYSNFTYFLDDPVNGDQFNQREKRWVFGGSLEKAWIVDSAGRTVENTVGLQARGDAIGGLGLHRTVARQRLSMVREDDVGEYSAGVFARTTWRWAERWRLLGGVRADAYVFDVQSNLAANSGETSEGIVSPKLGLVFEVSPKTEIYLNGGYGFHSNDARGTTIRVDPVSGEAVDAVSPLVRSRGAELGLRTAAVKGLVSTVSLWLLDLDSELVFVGDAGGTEPSGATRRYGVEWANFYRPLPWLVLDADLALTHGRYRGAAPADRIANSIGTVVTAGVGVPDAAGWFGSVRLRYFGRQPLSEDNAVTAPASSTVNVVLGRKSGSWEIAAEVLNVFDRANNDIAYFYASRLPGESEEGVDDVHFHPAEPRMVRLRVSRVF